MKRRFLCLFLALVLLLSCLPAGAMAADETPSGETPWYLIPRYTVLLLDVEPKFYLKSGGSVIYTVESPINNVKAAAQKFVEQTQSTDIVNYVAVVPFSTTPSVAMDFTTDTQALSGAISNLKQSSSFAADFTKALQKADELLSNVTDPEAIKNIVIFNQGASQAGAYSDTGRYAEKDLPDWINNNTRVRIWKYGNAAYAEASSLFSKYNIYSIGLFQSLASVPAKGLPVANFFRRLSKDIQNKGFYEVDSVNDLAYAFRQIAGEVTLHGGEPCPAGNFQDMPAVSHWAHYGIDFAVRRKLFNGVSTTTFGPNVVLNRAMLVTLLWRLNDQPSSEFETPFEDVSYSSYYGTALRWATENSIILGVDDTHFAPNQLATREQLAAIMYRYAAYKGYDLTPTMALDAFPDQAAVRSYARQAIAWACKTELITGEQLANGQIYLKPRDNATRAQVATIFMRFVKIFETEPSPAPEA